jgi:hypothetical protein
MMTMDPKQQEESMQRRMDMMQMMHGADVTQVG